MGILCTMSRFGCVWFYYWREVGWVFFFLGSEFCFLFLVGFSILRVACGERGRLVFLFVWSLATRPDTVVATQLPSKPKN